MWGCSRASSTWAGVGSLQHAHELNVADRTTFITASMDDLALADGTADAVMSRMSALLLGDPAATTREMVRVLKPGGRFAPAVWARGEDHPLLALSHRAIVAHVAAEVAVDTIHWTVHRPDFDAIWELAWSIWSGALADLNQRTVTRNQSTVRQLLEPYRSPIGNGYAVPATCQVVYGTR